MQETQKTQVRSLAQEDPLEKEMATHSSILAWGIPWTGEPGGLQSMGVTKELDTTQWLTTINNSIPVAKETQQRGGVCANSRFTVLNSRDHLYVGCVLSAFPRAHIISSYRWRTPLESVSSFIRRDEMLPWTASLFHYELFILYLLTRYCGI